MTTPTFDIQGMRDRLDAEIKKQRRSRTEVSVASGNSSGYLTNVITREQVPTVDRLDAICRELNVSMAYIMYGVDIPSDFQDVFDLMKQNPQKFYAVLALLK